MKKGLAIVLAGAFLSAGCSDSTEKSAAATPTPTPVPVPELTAEQLAVIEAEGKAAVKRKQDAARMTEPDAAVAPAQTADLPLTAQAPSPSPTPTAAKRKR